MSLDCMGCGSCNAGGGCPFDYEEGEMVSDFNPTEEFYIEGGPDPEPGPEPTFGGICVICGKESFQCECGEDIMDGKNKPAIPLSEIIKAKAENDPELPLRIEKNKVRLLSTMVDGLDSKSRNLSEALREAVNMLEHYGPAKPDHCCGAMDVRCDQLCADYADFGKTIMGFKELLK